MPTSMKLALLVGALLIGTSAVLAYAGSREQRRVVAHGLPTAVNSPAEPAAQSSVAEPAPAQPTATPRSQASAPAQPARTADSTAAPQATPRTIAAPSNLLFDDFSSSASGWAPLFFDGNGNANGYSAGAYQLVANASSNILYDIHKAPAFPIGSADFDISAQGQGEFGLLLAVEGDPNSFSSLAFYAVVFDTNGTVTISQRQVNAASAQPLTAPAQVSLAPAGQANRVRVTHTGNALHVLLGANEVAQVAGVPSLNGAFGIFALGRSGTITAAFDNMLLTESNSLEQPGCATLRALPHDARAAINGDDIRQLQARLIALGYLNGEPTGQLDNQDAAAMANFQRQQGIQEDEIGPQTWCTLFSGSATVAQLGIAEAEQQRQLNQPAALRADASVPAPALVSIRQPNRQWRIALILPGVALPFYIDTGGDALDAALSPNQRWLAFTTLRNGYGQIWLLDLAQGTQRQISRDDLDSEFPAWSPDSSQLLYTGEPRGASAAAQAARDYVYDLASGNNRLLSEEHAGWADWSALNELVFTRWTGKSFDLFRMNPDGSGAINLTNTDDRDEDIAAWSPDGQQIAFASNARGDLSTRRIFVMSRDGSNMRPLTDPGVPSSNPAWLGDNRSIVFVGQVSDEIWQPWLVGSDGAGLTPLMQNEYRVWFFSGIGTRS